MNADIRYYIVHANQPARLAWVNTSHVGKCISTKAVGCNEREDLTSDYKFPEGSTEERAVASGMQSLIDSQNKPNLAYSKVAKQEH